jgi:hypothetical protein
MCRPDFPSALRHFLINKKRLHRRGKLSEHHLNQLRELGVPWAALDTVPTQMIARLTRLAREFGRANVEAMANRETDLSEWIEIQLATAARGELAADILRDLRRVGIDIGDRQSTGEPPVEKRVAITSHEPRCSLPGDPMSTGHGNDACAHSAKEPRYAEEQ